MNRDILFRGKRIDNGEWVEGGYFKDDCYGNPDGAVTYIIVWNTFGLGFIKHIQVLPSTVSQYTGLTDKNGKKIFEGDIITAEWNGEKTAAVVFESGMYKAHGMSLITWTHPECRAEVIGTIWDKEN